MNIKEFKNQVEYAKESLNFQRELQEALFFKKYGKKANSEFINKILKLVKEEKEKGYE